MLALIDAFLQLYQHHDSPCQGLVTGSALRSYVQTELGPCKTELRNFLSTLDSSSSQWLGNAKGIASVVLTS